MRAGRTAAGPPTTYLYRCAGERLVRSILFTVNQWYFVRRTNNVDLVLFPPLPSTPPLCGAYCTATPVQIYVSSREVGTCARHTHV